MVRRPWAEPASPESTLSAPPSEGAQQIHDVALEYRLRQVPRRDRAAPS
jgi:hypothetical protein